MLWEIIEVIALGLVTIVVVVMAFEFAASKTGEDGPVDWLADRWHQLTCDHPKEAGDMWFDAARDCWFDICQVCARTWYAPNRRKPMNEKSFFTQWHDTMKDWYGKPPKV